MHCAYICTHICIENAYTSLKVGHVYAVELYACMYVCMHACTYVCEYAFTCVRVCSHGRANMSFIKKKMHKHHMHIYYDTTLVPGVGKIHT
jgi:hypothetical protein